METIELLRSGQLTGAKRLNLHEGFTQFPTEILDLADSLEILDLSDNHLTSLPQAFAQLKKLRIVFFNNNAFEEVPEILSQCPNLSMVGFKSNPIKKFAENALPPTVRWLILTNNRLEQLPASIGNLKNLQKLMLAGNQLTSLPDELALCRNLELIRLAANRLTELPEWLLTLPRLSWLAYSGNPFCQAIPYPERSLPHIDWADITLGNTLGQGASGIISQGIWSANQSAPQEVAVKIFKGEITSDGSPLDEMQACIAAGAHENIVGVLGKLHPGPEHKAGLVLPFISSDYRTLGNPPDFDSCTRDTYSPETNFSLAVILRIAQGIAAAAAHLHSRGIMHSDLYAHNILVNETGHSFLGDFGAASFYDRRDAFTSQALEQLEARAFGCLLEDLVDRCKPEDFLAQEEAIAMLRSLQQDCMHPIPAMRPLFGKICELLAKTARSMADSRDEVGVRSLRYPLAASS